ncbi:MAG: hypothetical protein AAFN42_21965 [Cyanobacteria bacterium J06554_1]
MATDPHNISPTPHWFVPITELDAEAGAQLRPADTKPSSTDPVANEGDPFLVTLETLLIVDQHDRKSDNDLLVRSRLKYGNTPITEAINFFENDVPAGVVKNNLLCEYIYSQEQYSKLDRVHLEIEVMELPGDISLNRDIAKGLKTIKNTFGIVLSSFLPFGGIAFDVMEKVNTVRKEKRRIFFSNLDLYGEGGEGEARLRYGAYIFFKEPIDGSNYKLQKLQVKPLVSTDKTTPFPYDYVVVKIVSVPIRVGSNEQLALHNQKLATTLGSIDRKNGAKKYPNFEQGFIPDPQKLKRLALFYSLQKRKDAQETLDEAQTKIYQKLFQELQEFI